MRKKERGKIFKAEPEFSHSDGKVETSYLGKNSQ